MYRIFPRLNRGVVSRLAQIKNYYPIRNNLFSLVLFFTLPPRFIPLEQSCRFNMKGLLFDARKSDFTAVKEIVLREEYAFTPSLIQRSKPIIFDLGANIGMFAIFMFSMFRNAEVHSVEASSNTFQILRINQQLNISLNWHIYQEAVWGKDETVQFQVTGMSTLRRISTENMSNSEWVKAITLKRIIERCESRIDICKIDIEGAEEFALVASLDALDKIDNLILEIHPKISSEDKILQILREKYRFIYAVKGRRSDKPLIVASNHSTEVTGLELYTDA